MRAVRSWQPIPLIVAGAPAWVILATGFCVNLRFVVFSLHLRPYLMHLPRWRRLVNGFLTADLSYALFTAPLPEPAADAAGRGARRRPTWPATTASPGCAWMGCQPGRAWRWPTLIPSSWGLGFAGVLCLVGILCSLANTALRLLAAVMAGAAAVAAYALPLKLNIVAAIAVAVAVVLAGSKSAVAPPARERAT